MKGQKEMRERAEEMLALFSLIEGVRMEVVREEAHGVEFGRLKMRLTVDGYPSEEVL